jgi:polar amino acid transport system permease protein
VSGLHWDWQFAWSIVPELIAGIRLTILATLFGSIVSFVLGLVWTLVRFARVRWVTPVVEFVVQFVRGTPLLVQLYFLFYIFPEWGVSLSAFATGVLGLGVFYSAYTAEIYRAGIENLPAGQWEAALTLGLPIRRVWLGIVLPQSVRTILPMLGNQIIGMFKESSLLSTITVMELLARGNNIGSINYRYVEPLTMVGAFYLVVSYTAARLIRGSEASHAAYG